MVARAPKRAKGRIERLRAEEKRARAVAGLRAAPERERAAPVHHPDPGRTADEGMRPKDSREPTVTKDPRGSGRVSQFVRNAQVRRDA